MATTTEKIDLEYYDKGLFVGFLPNTKEGESAYNEIVKVTGDNYIRKDHLREVLKQLRKAGYNVKKSKKSNLTMDEILNDPLLKELGI